MGYFSISEAILELRFVGRYEILDGGNMENAALFMSGGIQDVYCAEIAKYLTNKQPITTRFAKMTFDLLQREYKHVGQILPNVDELFTIISCAVKRNDLVGAFTTYVTTIVCVWA